MLIPNNLLGHNTDTFTFVLRLGSGITELSYIQQIFVQFSDMKLIMSSQCVRFASSVPVSNVLLDIFHLRGL